MEPLRHSRFTVEEMLDIRALFRQGYYAREVAELYGAPQWTLFPIKRGTGIPHIQTEEDLYKWHVGGGSKRDSIVIPYRVRQLRYAYCGFRLSSYGLRKYGRKNITIFIDAVKVCEHGELCEDCCFEFTGPLNTYRTKKTGLTNHSLTVELIGPKECMSPMDFTCECTIAFSRNRFVITPECRNYRCTNIAHATYHRIKDYAGTRQKTPRDD